MSRIKLFFCEGQQPCLEPSLTHIMPLVSFYTNEKLSKQEVSWYFQGVIERDSDI